MNLQNLKNFKARRLWIPVAIVAALALTVSGIVFATVALPSWNSPVIHVVPVINPPPPTPDQLSLVLSSPDFTSERTVNPNGTTQFGISLENPSLTGAPGYDGIIVEFAISKTTTMTEGDVVLKYYDGATWQIIPTSLVDNKIVGYFGPSTGFPVPAQYNVTTQIQARFMAEGDYSATIQCVQVGS